MDFANLFSVILLLVAAGLTVLAGLPVLRKWQRERGSGWDADAARGLAGEAPAEYGADVAMEERGHLTQPDQHRLVDHHPHDDQDEQMRNRPADEQHQRLSHLGGSSRQRQAGEEDPRRAHDVPVNGHGYGGFDDLHDDVHDDRPAGDVDGAYDDASFEDRSYENGRYEVVDADEARRAAHFDWKVAAQYERARAARNASMSSFEPPPLPSDGPGTFTEEIPAIHAADGQRRHPAVHADPDAPAGQPLDQRLAGPPPGQAPFDDPWGSERAVQTPPAFEFDEQRYEAYEEHAPDPRAYQPPQAPYGGFEQEPVDAEELTPPPHMRWQPDPEPDAEAVEEPPYGRPSVAPGPRQAFAATTFRVQPAAEEPVSVHVAEPGLPPDQHDGYPGSDPTAEPGGYAAAARGADPTTTPPGGGYMAGYAGTVPNERPMDGWVGDDTATYPGVGPEPAYSGYAAPGPATGYEPPGYDEPARPPVFEDPAEPGTGEGGTPFGRVSQAATPIPMPPPRPPLPDLSPLLANDEVAELRQRWNEIKGTFPDDPVTAVKEASDLVGECTELFERRLGVDPDGTDVSTEDLRLALQRYLAFFERLLSS